MFLARMAVRRPVLTGVIVVVFIVLGLQSYQRLALELTPNIDFPVVIVQTIYKGAGPKEVETQVTKRIEDEVATLSDLKKLKSITMESISYVVIQFEFNTDADLKAIEVKDKVDAILYDLPDDAEKPSVKKFDFGAMPIIQVSMTSNRSLTEMYTLADTVVSDRLAQVPGVGNVEISGGREREIHVLLRRDLAQAYGLSLSSVSGLIAAENVNVPGGRIIKDYSEYSIRMVGEFEDYRKIGEVKIPLASGAVIRLGDIAEVKDAFVEPRTDGFFAARPLLTAGVPGELPETVHAVNLGIIKKTGANTVNTADGVKKVVEELRRELPQDYHLSISNDNSEYIRDASSSTINNIFIGILLTSLLLFFFLHNTRATLIVAVVMPASLVATFLLLDFAGFTLNIVTLMALGIAVSTLVTNAIVVLESIAMHLEKGKTPAEAAIDGTSEVTIAVVASTLTNVVVFTPIAFMSGIVGIMMKSFGLTIVFATLLSLLMSFTLIPMLSALILRQRGTEGGGPHMHWFGRTFDWLLNSFREDYGRMLDWGMRHRWVFVLGTVLTAIGGFYLFGFIGSEFMATGDEGIATISVELPVGSSLEHSADVLGEIDQRIRRTVPELQSISLNIGGDGAGVEEGTIVIDVGDAKDRNRSIKDIINVIRPELAQIPAAETSVTIGEQHGGTSADLEVDVLGSDIEEVKRIAAELKEIMRTTEGLADVRMDYKQPKPEFAFRPNRDQISRYGMTSVQVAMEIRNSFEGEEASLFREAGEEYDIRVMLSDRERQDPETIKNLHIQTPRGSVPIDQLGTIELTTTEAEINREDKMRIIPVLANITHGVLGEKQAALQAEVDRMTLGSVRVKFGGYSEHMAETFESIISALILAIVLTYLVLAGIQESVVHPVTVMITLPLGALGAAVSLFLANATLNLFSLMAIVMLVGVVVNNAILIFDYTAQLRDRGMPLRPALIESSKARLRPILMMNLAIAASMIPQAMGGSGAEFRQAMAIVTMGGVLISMIFTLFLLPVLYSLFDRLTVRGRREKRDLKAATM